MAYKVVIQPQAGQDITDAFLYLSERAPDVAVRWYKQVRTEILSLNEMPARCLVIPESALLQYEMRQLLCGKRPGVYRIIFRIVEDLQEVHVLAVRHSARKPLSEEDLEALLQEDS